MAAEDSSAAIADNGETVFHVERVIGDLFRPDGSVASKFVAPVGVADQRAGRLELTGGVQLTSVGENVVLSADKVVFDEGAGYVRAEGNVWIESANMRLGPLKTLLATPDLERVGTPEIFES